MKWEPEKIDEGCIVDEDADPKYKLEKSICKECGSDSFLVGWGSYELVLKCSNCKTTYLFDIGFDIG